MERLSRLNAPEYPLLLSLEKLGLGNLARASLVPGTREIVDNTEIGLPALGLGVNGLPQKREDLSDLVDRAVSPDMAQNHFDDFALLFSLAYERGGKLLPYDVADSLKTVMESGGNFQARFPGNPEGATIDGIYYAQTYLRAMIGSDNAPGNFIKALEQAAGPVEDFRMGREEMLSVLNRFPLTRAVFNYLFHPSTFYQLQDAGNLVVTGQEWRNNPGWNPTDPRAEIQTILAAVRGGGAVVARGVNLNAAVPANRQLLAEAEVQLGYALFEAAGGRSAINHLIAEQTAPGVYRFRTQEVTNHIFLPSRTPGAIADPFCSIDNPREFVMGVKQRFGREVGKDVGMDKLDIEWKTYAHEIVSRAQANNRSVFMEMVTEGQLEANPANPMNYPIGAEINGRPVAGTPVGGGDRSNNRYPEGLRVRGIDLGGQEMFVNMVRNYKKFSKGSALFGALYKLLLNPFGDPKTAIPEVLDTAAEYARDAFSDSKSRTQRERVIPKVTSVIMKTAAVRGMPVPDEVVNRAMHGQKTDYGMYKGLDGFFKSRVENVKIGYYQGVAEARSGGLAPKKGEGLNDVVSEFAKAFFGGK